MRQKLSSILLLLVLGSASALSAGWEKDAIKQMNAAFEGRRFVAKVDLRTYAHYYVHADGTPVADKKQNKGGKTASTICCGPDVQVQSGGVGEGIWLYRIKDDEIWMGFKREGKRQINPAMAHILFDREVTPEDVEPAKLARAVSSLVEIEGFEAGADLARAFDEALAAGTEATVPAPPAVPESALAGARVWVEPVEVVRGGEVRLQLEVDVAAGGAGSAVTESLTLLLGAEALPGYPVSSTQMREPGVHRTSYTQQIPATAPAGTYTLRGEVCAGSDCIARTVAFEVR